MHLGMKRQYSPLKYSPSPLGGDPAELPLRKRERVTLAGAVVVVVMWWMTVVVAVAVVAATAMHMGG